MLRSALSPGESAAGYSQSPCADGEVLATGEYVPARGKTVDAAAHGAAPGRSEPHGDSLLSERGQPGEDAVPGWLRGGLSRNAAAGSRGFSRDHGTFAAPHGFAGFDCTDRYCRIPADTRASRSRRSLGKKAR